MMSTKGDQLLCEACGYPIGGMPQTAVCPECGLAITGSDPARRIGSPWQQRPGIASWVRTNWRTLRHPIESWRDVAVETPRSIGLMMVNIMVATAFATGMLIPKPGGPRPPAVSVVTFSVVTMLLLAGLTSIEFNGIRILGRRHRYRISRASATAIVAHASVGWLISGAGIALIGQAAKYAGMPRWFAARQAWVDLLFNLGLPFAAGMIAFSLLAGAGYHAMRYANRST